MQEMYLYQGEIFQDLKDLTQRMWLIHERWNEMIVAMSELAKKTKADVCKEVDLHSPNGV